MLGRHIIRGRKIRWLAAATGAGCVLAGSAVAAKTFGEWGPPQSAEQGSDPSLNTAFNDGCPILSPDGRSLYMATNRPGGLGGQDIWVAKRSNTRSGWGPPQPLPAPVNSAADDFCPTPVRGKGLFFVTKREAPDGDIYFTRQSGDGEWMQPTRLGPNINSPQEEWSPSFFYDERGNAVLYFSRNTFVPGGPPVNQHDIYYSVNFGPAQLAPGGVNSQYSDARPNVRKDGLEMVWDANRPGSLGAQDIWTASRSSTDEPWGPARHLTEVSSSANESRASLSWDGSYLLFGSFRAPNEGAPAGGPGASADIWVTTRDKQPGGEEDGEGDED